jgi:hypothetical protein
MNEEQLSKEEINNNLDILYQRRDFLEKNKIKFGDSFDKYLLIFSNGSLYLSIIFVNSVSGEHKYLIILILGWISFLISIISCLFAIFFSMRAHRKQVGLVDEDINKMMSEGTTVNGTNKYNFWVDFFQVSSLLGFMTGIVLFSMFFLLNIK